MAETNKDSDKHEKQAGETPKNGKKKKFNMKEAMEKQDYLDTLR